MTGSTTTKTDEQSPGGRVRAEVTTGDLEPENPRWRRGEKAEKINLGKRNIFPKKSEL